ncbi:MAG TPA: acetyl-CoA C-acetyltransferase [Hellea balneolensis]|uniref:Acetyl-CoA C-acetyltransferase n=1 Tax=Hellea balneolensis TaxID=287478 RepID=A0A7C5QPL8_9PROT|nr:acetyl-CoA C-acetyltransferase [Hellea balneolensis]
MTTAYIYDAIRTPRGKGKKSGSLHEITALSLAVQQLEALRDRNGLDTSKVDDVIMGCVHQVKGQGADIARSAVITANWDQACAGVSINRFCASGLEAVNIAAAKVMSGMSDMVVGGGVESLSRIPMGSDGGAMGVDPSIAFDHYIIPQGISADLIATKYGFSRDDCDAYAVESQKRTATSWAEGRFAKSIVPVKDQLGVNILEIDEHMRPGTDMQSLGSLNPSFAAMGTMMPGFDFVAMQKYPEIEKINHVHHAGNSSGIVDGASLVLVGSEAAGKAQGLKPRARIRAFAEIGSEPTIMLTGPEFVSRKVLQKAGMEVGDIDLWEINEAFASVVLRAMQALDIPHEKMNVNGGAIAMGHPLGATGAMIIGTMVDELERADKNTALITLCVGGGMGSAIIIERV